jgi:hypothetical protein
MRELAQRSGDGLTVTLWWDPIRAETYLGLGDQRTGCVDGWAVPKEKAMDAFEHPFRYEPATEAVKAYARATTRRR